MTHKPSKVVTAKTFSLVCMLLVKLALIGFLIHVITGRHSFYKRLFLSDVFFNRHVLAFFESGDLKEVRILPLNNDVMLMPRFQIECIVHHNTLYLLNFLFPRFTLLFYDIEFKIE